MQAKHVKQIQHKKNLKIKKYGGIVIIIILYVSSLAIVYSQEISTHITYKDEGFIEPFFCQETNCSQMLTLLLRNASAYCAFYDLGDANLIGALDSSTIQTILFEENYEEEYSFATPVKSKGLMHNKFCVINESIVLTGSWNPTYRGTNKNDNYILVIGSKKISSWYVQLWKHLQNRAIKSPAQLHLKLSGIPVDLFACPQHNCEDEHITSIQKAKETIKILAFTFTSKPIAQALIAKEQEDVNVSVVFEKTRVTRYATDEVLAKQNVSVKYDTNPYTMHEKLFIIDNITVFVGSYNPTKNANENNDENVLRIQNEQIAKKFINEFNNIANNSKK
ncbi:MAG: phospholipase D-like domain-containing protein [Candidatus Woesearchaeota archaeon]